MRICEYRPEDLDALYEIDRICFPVFMAYSRAELLYYLRPPGAICRVACSDGKIAGFVIGRIESGDCGHVITLDVAPEARRSKVGTRLMQALHDEFRRRAVRRFVLEVETGNEAAIAFYERFGYRRMGRIRGYYQSRRDAYRMVLSNLPCPPGEKTGSAVPPDAA